MQPRIDIVPVMRQSSDGNIGNEGVKNVDLKQARICFDALPQSADDVRQIDRSGENGKYMTMALAICAFHAWTPQTADVSNGMLEVLLNSPTCGITFNNFGKQFIKDRMMQNNKYPYIAKAYFDGASPENGYQPTEPLAVTLEEYVYNIPASTMYGATLNLERVVTRFKGADTERYMDLYMDPKDNNWYIWSDSYKGLLADIKTPRG